jgi:uncharacterized membrane protein YhaH (DUF805 family)
MIFWIIVLVWTIASVSYFVSRTGCEPKEISMTRRCVETVLYPPTFVIVTFYLAVKDIRDLFGEMRK